MQSHTVEGARIILESDRELDLAAAVAYEHHIMINGGGYPHRAHRAEVSLRERARARVRRLRRAAHAPPLPRGLGAASAVLEYIEAGRRHGLRSRHRAHLRGPHAPHGRADRARRAGRSARRCAGRGPGDVSLTEGARGGCDAARVW